MVIETMVGLDRRIKRVVLEKNFPTLMFEFFRSAERDQDFIRVRRRDEVRYFDEVIHAETFPTDEFITRCALIA